MWHPDVELYAVHDAASGAVVGHFFLDLFPRDGKFGHQCVLPLRPAYVTADGTQQTPVVALVGNNPKVFGCFPSVVHAFLLANALIAQPTAARPSLLIHDQVSTDRRGRVCLPRRLILPWPGR